MVTAVRVVAFLLVAALAACSGQSPASTPGVDGGGSTTLAIVADFGNCGPGARRVADMVEAWRPAAVATAGDNTYDADGCAPFTDSVGDYYAGFIQAPGGPRFFPALGNHDYEDDGAGLAAYRSYFSYLPTDADPQQRWYSVRVDRVRLFVLDNDAPQSDLASQRRWLQEALAASRESDPAVWNVVVLHKPAFSSGPHDDEVAMRPAAGWHYGAWGADVVVAGHQHVYEDVVVDGVHHVTAGIGTNGLDRGGCDDQPAPGSRICLEGEGALRLTGTEASLVLEYRQPSGGPGSVRDSITLTR